MHRCFAYLSSTLVMFFKASSPLSIIVTLFALLAGVIEKSVCVDDPYYDFELCERSRACGGLNISFPFYIDERECGYPGFQVSCHNNSTTILKTSGDSYIVHQIFYQNQTLHVSVDMGSACRYSFKDLENGQFDYFGNSNFFFLSGCSAPLSDDLVRYKINCSGASPVLAIRSEDPNWDLAANQCRLKDWAVVEEADDDDDEGYLIGEELVRRGFMLKWISTSECPMCEESGGKCGFDNDYYRFQCFCPDGPRADHCFSGNQKPVAGNHKLRKLELGLGLCIGFLLVIGFFFLWWRHRSIKQSKDHPSIEAFLRSHGSLAPKRYSNSDIKKMTNSFKDKIGEGGYGVVYKGNPPGGRRQKVAVKVLNETKGDGEEFINEVASISKTSHINVVTLLGFCFDGPKRALVYEFMPNGSLDKYLCKGNPSKIKYMLGWGTLYKIAVGIARGLEYLHRGCNTRILHFDIKPHNILLSDTFCPKISDFGLAELCTRKDSVIPMQGTRGTPGYIAPEVFSRAFGGVSHKSDVYSYGMVVLDMVGARKDVDGGRSSHSTDEVYFPDSIYKSIEEEVLDYGSLEILNDERDCARKMKIVSLWCIQMKPSDRPSMRQVMEMLEGSLESLRTPPKPVLFSPPVSLQYSTTTTASGISKGNI